MSGENDAQYRAMVEFLGTFPTLSGTPPSDISELSDGVVLFEVLSEIAPDYFDPTTIARHLGDNWALKSSNLRKLVRNLGNYFREDLNKDAPESFDTLNIADIAREAKPEAIALLVELVAAAAVTCPERAEYVGRIMQMTPKSQLQMKGFIERSLSRLSKYEDEENFEDGQEEEVGDDNEMVFNESEGGEDDDGGFHQNHLFAAGHLRKSPEADAEIAQLEKELADARREVTNYKNQAGSMAEDNGKSQKKLKRLVEDLQDRLVVRQDELIDTEEELRNVTSELVECKSKLGEVEEAKNNLADELDVAKSRVNQLRRAEATVVAYRKKLEGVSLMNQEMTDLEETAASYLRQIMDLESEVKKSTSLQKTVEGLNKKIAALEKGRSELCKSIKNSEGDVADLKSRLNAAEKTKKMFEEELTDLRAQQQGSTQEEDTALDSMEGLSLNSTQSITAAKEKAMRLEIENKSLKEELVKLGGSGGDGAGGGSGDTAGLQQEINRLQEELAKKKKENSKIGSDKDKLETYTKRTLAKFQDKYLVALQDCKSKLKEKQDKIEALEARGASEKNAQKREERLLSSTVYELGLAIMQNRLKER